MNLNQVQRQALHAFLSTRLDIHLGEYDQYNFDKFCDGEITEWRIIWRYGMAGKIWNNYGRIYISGYSSGEIGDAFDDQQVEIKALNEELEKMIAANASTNESGEG